ncbi:MAG: entericidin A/B family lipoprotein [Verrucomicrobiota bacterium]
MKTTTLTLLALAFLAVVALSGCNTVRGVGQDVSATGRGVSRGAGAVQSAM